MDFSRNVREVLIGRFGKVTAVAVKLTDTIILESNIAHALRMADYFPSEAILRIMGFASDGIREEDGLKLL